jgi:hypothetical protein
MKWFRSPRHRWYFLAAAWVALLILGYGGFVQQSKESGANNSVLDNLYLTLQLATLDYEGGDTDVNWRLQIARFVAPMMAAGTVLQGASVIFRDQFQRWRIGLYRGHMIVCGLGAAGSRLAVALADKGHKVVGLDANPASAGMATLRDHDIPCLEGDATDPSVLRSVRADRAAGLVALCATDAQNVSVTTAARMVDRDGRRGALRCSVHLTDTELTELLRGAELGGTDTVRVEFFNLHERAARALLAEKPPFGDGSALPHVIVMGLGQLGRSLVVAAAQQWAEVGEGPLPITMIDREATGRWEAMCLQHPALEAAVRPNCLDIDLEAPTPDVIETFTATLHQNPPTLVAIVFEDESLALSTGLFTHRALGDGRIPIVVRTEADAGLGSVVTPMSRSATPARFPGLTLFPFLDRACSPAIIEGGVREQLARAIHEDHTARTGIGEEGYHRAWQALTDDERESSRRSADGIVDSVAELGYELMPLRSWGTSAMPFTDDELELLAEREHERWKAERENDGWSYGEVRDNQLKRNPLLVPWRQLSAEAQAENLAAIRAMPEMLARAGFAVVRNV